MSAADRAIRISTAAAVLGVAGIAAYLSYWHAYEVVHAHGESGATARLEPATIDGLVYASSMVILYAVRHRLPVPALARWLLALGIVATLAANVAHGWVAGPVGAVVAAWPAASLVGSYELLLWLVRTGADGASTGPATSQAGHAAGGLRLVSALPGGPDGCETAPAPGAGEQASGPGWASPNRPRGDGHVTAWPRPARRWHDRAACQAGARPCRAVSRSWSQLRPAGPRSAEKLAQDCRGPGGKRFIGVEVGADLQGRVRGFHADDGSEPAEIIDVTRPGREGLHGEDVSG